MTKESVIKKHIDKGYSDAEILKLLQFDDIEIELQEIIDFRSKSEVKSEVLNVPTDELSYLEKIQEIYKYGINKMYDSMLVDELNESNLNSLLKLQKLSTEHLTILPNERTFDNLIEFEIIENQDITTEPEPEI
jgi:hypothetical protein